MNTTARTKEGQSFANIEVHAQQPISPKVNLKVSPILSGRGSPQTIIENDSKTIYSRRSKNNLPKIIEAPLIDDMTLFTH